MRTEAKSQPILVKRYAQSTAGVAFSVIDAEDGADITRILLA